MQPNLIRGVATTLALGLGSLESSLSQMHKVAKAEDVVRAVAVYEWTGDRVKPTATRLIPVTIFIDNAFQDAGIYLARPVPFALDVGTVYEVDRAGVPEGTVDLVYARHLKAAGDTASFDDGWFGYGTFVPPPARKKTVALKQSKTPAVITSSKEDPQSDRPTFSRRPDHSDVASPSKSPVDSNAPETSSTATPPDDPDRPHLSKKSDETAKSEQTGADHQPAPDEAGAEQQAPAAETSASTSTGNPTNDPDRPTLKKRSPEEAKKARREAEQSSATGLATSLNDDPNRPTLHRGNAQHELTEADLPKLKGLSDDLHQAVAVSDASKRPVHDFSRPWESDAERSTVLARMQTLAQAQIAAYRDKPTVTRKPNSKLRHATVPESVHPASGAALEEEQLSSYTLSYGGAATFVYTAHTAGEGASLIYVTEVAQRDAFGELKVAIQNITDVAHLDRTPWMRPIDVVDADASNRASLLFELRGQTSRQFALYRVIAARSEQTFLSNTTQ